MSLTEEQRGTVGFDLEAARASISHYRIENTSNVDTESALKELVDQANLAEEYLAEIERLRAGHCADCCCARSWEALGISEYTGKSIPEEITHLREWMIKNRDAATELQYQLDDEVKENERLRKIIDSPPEEESWKADYDLLHQLDASGTVCVARKWHAAYRKAQNSNLLRKQENERLLDALVQCKHTVEQQAAQIKELEDALVNERAWRICHIPQDRVGHWPRYEPMLQDEARQQLQAEGKIGPDAAKPQSWQITEERKETLRRALEEYKIFPNDQAVLRAMLTEAGL